jgi:hypothetical protein
VADDTIIEDVLGALRRNVRILEADKLASQLIGSNATEEQWILLDCLLELGEPGDKHRPRPQWIEELWDELTPYMRWYVRERLERRREQMFDELKKDK